MLESLESGENPTIKLTQPSEFNDDFDTYIPQVYEKIPELRKKMATDLADTLCQSYHLSEEDCIRCKQKCKKTLSIDDWKEWFEALSAVSIEFQPGITETVSQIVEVDMQKFLDGHIEYQKEWTKNLGISCFSEKINVEYMWEKYAFNHKGFCFAYDVSVFDDIPKTGGREICGILPVRYIDDAPDLIKLAVKFFRSSFSKRLTLNKNEEKSLVWKTVLTKKPAWEEEMEWRLVVVLTPLQKTRIPSKEDRDVPLQPCCIYLGKDIDKEQEQEIRRVIGLLKVSGLCNIDVRKMRVADEGSGLIAGD